MGITQIFILIVLVLSLGIALGRISSKLFYRHEEKQAEKKAKLIVKEAKIEAAKFKRQKILEAKERFIRLKAEFEQGTGRRREKLLSEESYLKRKEQEVAQQLEQLHRKELALEEVREELEQLQAQKIKQLEGLSRYCSSQRTIAPFAITINSNVCPHIRVPNMLMRDPVHDVIGIFYSEARK